MVYYWISVFHKWKTFSKIWRWARWRSKMGNNTDLICSWKHGSQKRWMVRYVCVILKTKCIWTSQNWKHWNKRPWGPRPSSKMASWLIWNFRMVLKKGLNKREVERERGRFYCSPAFSILFHVCVLCKSCSLCPDTFYLTIMQHRSAVICFLLSNHVHKYAF